MRGRYKVETVDVDQLQNLLNDSIDDGWSLNQVEFYNDAFGRKANVVMYRSEEEN